MCGGRAQAVEVRCPLCPEYNNVRTRDQTVQCSVCKARVCRVHTQTVTGRQEHETNYCLQCTTQLGFN